MGRVEAEVRAAILVVDPRFGIDHAGTEPHVVRLDEAHRVAVAIDRREVGRAAAARRGRSGRRRGLLRIDPRGELRGVLLRDQPLDRDVAEPGIGELGVAVGHRQLRGLDAQVDPASVGHPGRPERGGGRRFEMLEDVDDLERNRPRRVRWVGGDPDAAVVGRDRVGPGRRVACEVRGAKKATQPRRGRVPAERRYRPRRSRRIRRRPFARASPPGQEAGRSRRVARDDRGAGRPGRNRNPARSFPPPAPPWLRLRG